MTNDQNIVTLKEQIQTLMAEVEKTNQENMAVNKQREDEMVLLREKVDVTAEIVEKDLAELDVIENETSDALDKVILEHSEDAGDDDL
jgi:uncharacterized protein YPO0396